MVTRQGWPKLVLSDNRTNYVGAAHEIKEPVKTMDQEKIKRLTSNQGINWLFNPPRALHFGGVLESNYLFLQLKLLLKGANTVFLLFFVVLFQSFSPLSSKLWLVMNGLKSL